MKIVVVGTGYVGLVTGTCFAESGNSVTCVDIDPQKIQSLKRGEVPIFEPGLAELVGRNIAANRLSFTTDINEVVPQAEFIFLAVGTPPRSDGTADLTSLWTVAEQLAPVLPHDAVVVVKSTVPVGTNSKLAVRLQELLGRECDVASNPEFLKEGAALEDFTKPDRVVVGVRRAEVGEKLKSLYLPYLRTENPFLIMSPESAEMTKYVANAFLATKISFINEVANLSEQLGADISDVRRGIGHDARIGFQFLFPGVGYGGSCFPKDVRALASLARQHDTPTPILDAVDRVNLRQKEIIFDKIRQHFGKNLSEITIAVWGLAFKPRTDDIREAPALGLIDRLLDAGVQVCVHDPVAMDNVKKSYADKLTYTESPLETLRNVDGLAVMTEWGEFLHPDFVQMKQSMRQPVVFDGRNIYDPAVMKHHGFAYYSIGRAPVQDGRTGHDNSTPDPG